MVQFTLVCCWVRSPGCVVRPLRSEQLGTQLCPACSARVFFGIMPPALLQNCHFSSCFLLLLHVIPVPSDCSAIHKLLHYHPQAQPLGLRQSAQWLKTDSEVGGSGLDSTFESYHHHLLTAMTWGKLFHLSFLMCKTSMRVRTLAGLCRPNKLMGVWPVASAHGRYGRLSACHLLSLSIFTSSLTETLTS